MTPKSFSTVLSARNSRKNKHMTAEVEMFMHSNDFRSWSFNERKQTTKQQKAYKDYDLASSRSKTS